MCCDTKTTRLWAISGTYVNSILSFNLFDLSWLCFWGFCLFKLVYKYKISHLWHMISFDGGTIYFVFCMHVSNGLAPLNHL